MQSVNVKKQIESEATAAHKVALAMHVSYIKAEPTEDPDAQDRYAHSILFCQTFIQSIYFRACKNLIHIIQPLLDGIFAYMGLQAHLVLGVLPQLPGEPPCIMAY